jgi:hypothetical protein
MCEIVRRDKQTTCELIGSYDKGNQPNQIFLQIYLAPCSCGKNVFGRLVRSSEWIEIESVEVNHA